MEFARNVFLKGVRSQNWEWCAIFSVVECSLRRSICTGHLKVINFPLCSLLSVLGPHCTSQHATSVISHKTLTLNCPLTLKLQSFVFCLFVSSLVQSAQCISGVPFSKIYFYQLGVLDCQGIGCSGVESTGGVYRSYIGCGFVSQ